MTVHASFFGPGNGFPMTTNVALVVVLMLVVGLVVIRFSMY